MSITTLAARLKGQPGVWSTLTFPIPPNAPAGDATDTSHGHGEHRPVPSFRNRMLASDALDVVRLYYLADDLDPNDTNKVLMTDKAGKLYDKAQLGAVPEDELVKHILGHWPLPPPSLWLLRIVDALGAYLTAQTMDPQVGGPFQDATTTRLQTVVGGAGDGVGAPAGGGHGN